MIQSDSITLAVKSLLEAAPGSRVILFGSRARGDARPDSDIDFLVIEPIVTQRRLEMVRLSDVLRDLGIHADVLVVSQSDFAEWADEPGTVYHEAARTGKVFDATP